MNIILFEPGIRHFDAKDERAQHLKKVLHAALGTHFRAGEIGGMAGDAVIESVEGGIDFTFTPESDLSFLYPVTLLLAEVRPICMRRILREVTSLGISSLILVISDLGEKSYADAGLYTSGEYRTILVNGAMQAGFTGVPKVEFATSLDLALSLPLAGKKVLLDNVVGSTPLSGMDIPPEGVVLAVGPERGWSKREVQVFNEHGFVPALMGKRILRTETAAVASVALALSRMQLL